MSWRSLAFLLLAAVLVRCGVRNETLPDSAGGPEEILVVLSKSHWESEPGVALRRLLEQPMEGMPQREALFRVAQCPPQHFAALLQVHHSVLFANIGADSSGYRAMHDVHARGQLLIRIDAADPSAWIALLQEHETAILRGFEEHQRARIARRLKSERDEALSGSIRSALGVHLDIPGGYRVVKQVEDFAWLQRDRLMSGSGLEHNVIEGLLIHRHPYISDSTWNVPFLVGQRDSITRLHVEGPDPGSYMIVQRRFEALDLMPTGRAVRLNEQFAYLMHGLYGMHGAKMGGPFVSLSALDATGTRIITVEGFVYAPQFDKRAYVREMEALLFSLRFAEDAGQ